MHETLPERSEAPVRKSHLAKLYIEPTNLCNLGCRTCIRHSWDEPSGKMSLDIFERIIAGCFEFNPIPLIFFGGFGEPLSHPRIVEMVTRAKAAGATVELITNATLLDKGMSRALVDAGLDMLWVSIDGATPESYLDIRLGSSLPLVLKNVAGFREVCIESSRVSGQISTRLGIEFVAMKRNVADLPAVLHLAHELGAMQTLVTNVIPYSYDMCDEALYYATLGSNGLQHHGLQGIDLNNVTSGPLQRALREGHTMTLPGNSGAGKNRCPFINGDAMAVRWDGAASPCLALMHSYTTYVHEWPHFRRGWSIGNIGERTLSEIWEDVEHVAFRERVQRFPFSPCTACGGCDLLDKNEEDCFSNTFPTCGGCLWAQGVIQCP